MSLTYIKTFSGHVSVSVELLTPPLSRIGLDIWRMNCWETWHPWKWREKA